jgi:nicotinamidase/pyrazinamidase
MSGTTLLIVDAQKDFHPGGSLAIPTADADAARIAAVIEQHGDKIDRVVATLDTHQKLHIAHPHFWYETATGKHPSPFTIISAADLEAGTYKPRDTLRLPKDLTKALDPSVFGDCESVLMADGSLDLPKYCLSYAQRLEAKGRFQICIWPEHCLIGSAGHALVDPIQSALATWSATTGGSVEWVWKGQALLTEMYSALEADVAVTPDTAFNQSLQDSLLESDRLLVCGQAMSHCVNYTLRDIVERWPADQRSHITLLTDGASAVPGFEAAAAQFQVDMTAAGVHLQKCADAFTD